MISILIKPSGNTQETFTEALALSTKLGVVVEFMMDDKMWSVRPDDELDEIVLKYYEVVSQRHWDDTPNLRSLLDRI